MRTPQEILDRMAERMSGDPGGFEVGEYVDFLDFAHAEEYLASCSEEEWNKIYKEPTRENVVAKMQDYLDFAWEKADNEKSVSANRSIMHYLAWIWLTGDDNFLSRVQHEYDERYCEYGKPILRMIEEHYGLER